MSRAFHSIEATNRPVAPSENRKGSPESLPSLEELDRDALQCELFYANTQPASDVLRRSIRHHRTKRGMSQKALAAAMAEFDIPLTHEKVSLIERGKRRVRYDELLAFAYVLDVPLATLMSPVDGERAIRAGGIGLEPQEVANWIVWGPPWTREATSAQTYMGLTRQIWTMMQVIKDEPRRGHEATLLRLLDELWRESPVKPGVMVRQSLRERMAAAD